MSHTCLSVVSLASTAHSQCFSLNKLNDVAIGIKGLNKVKGTQDADVRQCVP